LEPNFREYNKGENARGLDYKPRVMPFGSELKRDNHWGSETRREQSRMSEVKYPETKNWNDEGYRGIF